MGLRYISPIDGHVHLRWEEYEGFSYERMNFMQLGFRDAMTVGLRAVIEMPNTDPYLVNKKNIRKRIKLADKINPDPKNIYHGIHIGTTTNINQVRAAVRTAMESRNINWRVHAIKDYYSQSTGNMGILDPEYQRKMWFAKVEEGFNGVNMCHLEAEDCYHGKFDPNKPISHSEKQTPESELVQTERQIKNAKDAGFKGIFIPAHISNPDTIDYLLEERKNLPFSVAIEMTWHHMFLSTEDYQTHGNRVKMNPPLRTREMQERNLEHVLRGNVTMIGTDQAGHPLSAKDSKEPPSGVPAILSWPIGIAMLRKCGIDEALLRRITFHNANRIFNLNLEPREVDLEYNPELWKAYGYNPFSRIEEELGWKFLER